MSESASSPRSSYAGILRRGCATGADRTRFPRSRRCRPLRRPRAEARFTERLSAAIRRSRILPPACRGSRTQRNLRLSRAVSGRKTVPVRSAGQIIGVEQVKQPHVPPAAQRAKRSSDPASPGAGSLLITTPHAERLQLPELPAPEQGRILSPGQRRTRPGDDCDQNSRPRSGGPIRRMRHRWKRHPGSPGMRRPPSAAPAMTCPRDPRRNPSG